MKYNKEEAGKIIRKERVARKWTQAKLGEKVRVSGKQISNYEKGVTAPPVDVLFRLAEVFECEFGYLLGEEQYKDGTAIQTAITNNVGLSPEATKAIKTITGTEKSCLSFGCESERYRLILSSLLESKSFLRVFEALASLEEIERGLLSAEANLSLKYDPDTLESAWALRTAPHELENFDFGEYSSRAPEALGDIEDIISMRYDSEYRIKVFRWETQEAVADLLNEMFPKTKAVLRG